MRQSRIRNLTSWLVALTLAIPSLGACVCSVECVPPCSSGSGAGHPRSAGNRPTCGQRNNPAPLHSDGPRALHKDKGICGCCRSLAHADATLPVPVATVAAAIWHAVAIPEPPLELRVFARELKQPGFSCCDSGPPVASSCLVHPSRAPPLPLW